MTPLCHIETGFMSEKTETVSTITGNCPPVGKFINRIDIIATSKSL